MEVIDIVKGKIPVENLPTDNVLNVHIAEVRQAILTFCNRTDIPADLKFVHANMVVDLINENIRKADPDAQQKIKSIKEGDTQVNFESSNKSTSEYATQDILYNYKSQLLRFRKLRW